jgi:hypothetical protein
MKPGLLPVLCTEAPPSSQAVCILARTSASIDGGWWNAPQVVTTLMPAVSSRHNSSRSSEVGM